MRQLLVPSTISIYSYLSRNTYVWTVVKYAQHKVKMTSMKKLFIRQYGHKIQLSNATMKIDNKEKIYIIWRTEKAFLFIWKILTCHMFNILNTASQMLLGQQRNI